MTERASIPDTIDALEELHRPDRHGLTPALVREFWDLDPSTGVLTWRPRARSQFPCDWSWKVWNKLYAGKPTGSANLGGYKKLRHRGANYCQHRIVWAHQYGKWPKGDIDHINGDGTDNSIKNLRDVPHKVNSKNVKLRADNKTGTCGVHWFASRNKWTVRIKAEGKQKCLGYFENYDDAVAVRQSAEKKYGYHPNHGAQR